MSSRRDRSRPGDRSAPSMSSRRYEDDDDGRDPGWSRDPNRDLGPDDDVLSYDESEEESSYDNDRRKKASDTRDKQIPRRKQTNQSQPRRESVSFAPTSYETHAADVSRQHRPQAGIARRESTQTASSRLGGVFGERPAAPAPATSTLPPVSMTKVFANFLTIPVREFKLCARFVEEHPRVLDESTGALQKTAMALYARGDTTNADRCVERILMIRGCIQNGEEYLNDLRRRTSKIADFLDDFEQLRAAMLKASASLIDKPAPAPAVAKDEQPPPSAFRHDSMKTIPSDQASIANETASMASMRIGAPSLDRRSSIAGDVAGSYSGRGKIARTQSQSTALAYTPTTQLWETREPESQPLGRLSADAVATISDIRARGDKTSAITKSSLNKHYWVRKDAKTFFLPGRVFKVLWHQPGGSDIHGQVNPAKNLKPGAFGEPVYSTLRWMMVIKQKDGYALCCPISTYGGNGLTKKGLSESELRAHAIVYDSESRPKFLPGEAKLPKEPIEVERANGVDAINAASRVHFGKCYTVEWNVKVMNIGTVHPGQINKIIAYFLTELGAGGGSETSREVCKLYCARYCRLERINTFVQQIPLGMLNAPVTGNL